MLAELILHVLFGVTVGLGTRERQPDVCELPAGQAPLYLLGKYVVLRWITAPKAENTFSARAARLALWKLLGTAP